MIDPTDSSFEQLPLDAKRRVDAACGRFEVAWRAGRPRLQGSAPEGPAGGGCERVGGVEVVVAGEGARPHGTARFRREGEVIARLRHPNIVQIYDIGEVDGQCFLALEYAESGSLRDRLSGSPLEPR